MAAHWQGSELNLPVHDVQATRRTRDFAAIAHQECDTAVHGSVWEALLYNKVSSFTTLFIAFSYYD